MKKTKKTKKTKIYTTMYLFIPAGVQTMEQLFKYCFDDKQMNLKFADNISTKFATQLLYQILYLNEDDMKGEYYNLSEVEIFNFRNNDNCKAIHFSNYEFNTIISKLLKKYKIIFKNFKYVIHSKKYSFTE